MTRPAPPRHALLALVGCAVLVVGACTSAPEAPAPRGGTPTSLSEPGPPAAVAADPAVDPALSDFYGQAPAWRDCGDDRLQCTEVTVPVDWDAPAAGSIELAVVRAPATDTDARRGSLLVNPGGPGGSGVEYVTAGAESAASAAVRAAYDLVGFDPRGVGASEPVDCLSDAEMDAYLAFTADPETPRGLAAATAEAERFAAGCAADAGDLLGNLDTISVARDLDVLRAVLGDDHLSYLGYSYGTLIGAEYAELFPQRVGRVVLDGAIDPALTLDDVSLGQAVGREGALRAYVAACVAGESGGECPLRGTVEQGLAQVGGVLQAAQERPLRTDSGREVTGSLALLGVIRPLYDDASWFALDEALAGALNGDGTRLLELADSYAERRPDGTYASNLLEVFNAVNCLDYPADDDPASMAQRAARIETAAPTVGPYFGYGDVVCGAWDAPAVREPRPVRAAGAAPILVVGTTGDPATPYEWARSLADQLESGRLLTFEGEGHTAYQRSECVTAAVDGYLVDGVLPGEDATC